MGGNRKMPERSQDIVHVDYNLGGDGYVEQFRKDNLGDVECSCCNLLQDAKDTKSTILVGQKSLADLDAEITNMQCEVDGIKLSVTNTDLKEKAIESQINKFDLDIDLADDAVDAHEAKLNKTDKLYSSDLDFVESKESGLRCSVEEENEMRNSRVGVIEEQLFEKQKETEEVQAKCEEEGLIGAEASAAFNSMLKERLESDCCEQQDKLKEISDKCDELQTETGEAIGTVTGEPSAEVLAKVLQREKKRTLLARKHEQCTALRSEYAKETQALLKQIEALKGEVEEDEACESDADLDSSLKLLLELPEPSEDLLGAFAGSPEMDDDLVALQVMMGKKNKTWAKVLML